MQKASQSYFDALGGFVRYDVRADAWRDGRIVARDLPISGGRLSLRDGQAIRSRLTLAVTDPDGKYAPKAMGDALAPFGSELHVSAGLVVGSFTERFSLGWFPIQAADVDESFATYRRPTEPDTPILVSRGSTVQVECGDRAQRVAEDRFLGREQPPVGTSVLAEIRRLLSGRVPYAGTVGTVADASIPAKFTYDDDRLKACVDLAGVLDADFIFTPSGAAAVASRKAGAVVWTIPDGEYGLRAGMTRRLQRDGVYNAVCVRGQTADNQTLQAVRTIVDGSLKYSGPYGRVPYFYSSPVLTTQGAVNNAADTLLKRVSTVKPQEVEVVCVLNPALELGDVVRLPTPTAFVDGRVVQIELPLTSDATTMSILVAVDPMAVLT